MERKKIGKKKTEKTSVTFETISGALNSCNWPTLL